MHGKIPQECIQTMILPICKNRNGNISDAGNNKSVYVATITSKLFEHYQGCSANKKGVGTHPKN